MSVSLDGDFVNIAGMESFVWDDPCGGPQLTGSFDQTIAGEERPALDNQFVGSCRPDDTFFNHELSVEHPTLLFDDYDTLEELIEGCCTGSGTPSSSTESSTSSFSTSGSEIGESCIHCVEDLPTSFLITVDWDFGGESDPCTDEIIVEQGLVNSCIYTFAPICGSSDVLPWCVEFQADSILAASISFSATNVFIIVTRRSPFPKCIPIANYPSGVGEIDPCTLSGSYIPTTDARHTISWSPIW